MAELIQYPATLAALDASGALGDNQILAFNSHMEQVQKQAALGKCSYETTQLSFKNYNLDTLFIAQGYAVVSSNVAPNNFKAVITW